MPTRREIPGTTASVVSNIPIPDPTVLTTQALLREVSAIREVFETKIAAVDARVNLLFDSINARREYITEEITKHQLLQDEKFRSIGIQTDEKFRSISMQFVERDIRSEQSSRDGKVAVDAALQAAKEAVSEQNKSSSLAIAKSEAATTKQIDQIGTIISTMASGLNDKIDDIKSRITIIEGRAKGSEGILGYAFSIMAMAISVASIIGVWAKH
jgi:hypothetical protein